MRLKSGIEVKEYDIGRGTLRLDLQGRSGKRAARYVSRAFGRARCNKYDLLRWCESCRRWLEHQQGRCARLAWPRARCVCEIHTCYDARALGPGLVQAEAPVYRDFVEGER